MTKEELKPIDTSKYKITETGQVLKMTKDEMKDKISFALKDSILQQGFEVICKNLAELEEKISVLLSCKNCPENKGGFICVKEYENKCLSQKIEYINELKKEKCELLGIIQSKDEVIQELKKELNSMPVSKNQQLTKAKEIIRDLLQVLPKENIEGVYEITEEAELFIREVEK